MKRNRRKQKEHKEPKGAVSMEMKKAMPCFCFLTGLVELGWEGRRDLVRGQICTG